MSTTSNASKISENPGILLFSCSFGDYISSFNSLDVLIVSLTFFISIAGWQIIRTSESTSEEFVMIYDLYIEQAEVDEESDDNNKTNSSSVWGKTKPKESSDVFEE